MTTHGLHCAPHEDDSPEQLEHAAQLEERNAIAELAFQTPIEIDTTLYALYREHLDLRVKREHAMVSLRHTVDDKFDYYNKTWGLDSTDVLAKAQTIAGTDTTYVGKQAAERLAEYDRLTQALKDNQTAQKPFHDEYKRRPWTRGFLVTDGHVHSSMGCSTCFPTTEFTWLVDLSGKDEAEIVKLAGERACTVCYPTAPTLRDFEKASPLFTEEEAERNRQREARAAEKAARTEQKIAKGLTHDGSEFAVTYTEPDARCSRYNPETRQHEYYIGDRHHVERFKTEKAAVQWVVAGMASYYPRDFEIPARQAVIEAIATKHGKTVEQVAQEIDAKVQAKVKRDRRG